MATCESNINVSKVTPPDEINHASIGLPQSPAGVDATSLLPIGILVRSAVKITPAESVKRLGTGWRWWFSESVHVPIGHRIEFRFQGPEHLLVLYNEGLRRRGETSIDDLEISRLRSFVHKLTFVPAGCVYRPVLRRYECGGGTWLAPAYGANGLYYAVVPPP